MQRFWINTFLMSVMAGPICCGNGWATTVAERNLADYSNANGLPPSGKDDQTDDSEAMRKAIAAGPGVIRIGPGWYRFSDITLPNGVSLVAAGPATIVRAGRGDRIFRQVGVAQWRICNLVLDGGAQGDWHARGDKGRCGISVEKCADFEISGVTVQNFDGPGIELAFTQLETDAGAFSDGVLDRIIAKRNFIGVRFNQRAEYIHATRLACHQNVAGCVIHAGNAKLGDSNFCGNVDGLVIEDKDNGSHGAVANCLFNHNERNALWAKNVANGMALTNNCFFYGHIRIANSVGVNLQGSQISCAVTVSGKGVNCIANNYIIPRDWQFTFTPATIVKDNFTADGPWRRNGKEK